MNLLEVERNQENKKSLHQIAADLRKSGSLIEQIIQHQKNP
jgi:hypothetical protein